MGAAAYKVIRVKFAVQEIERRSLRALVMRSRKKEDHATRRLQGKFLRYSSILAEWKVHHLNKNSNCREHFTSIRYTRMDVLPCP